MNLETLTTIIERVRCLDRWFEIHKKGDGYLVQVCYRERCVNTGALTVQRARKHYVSSHATESEVVETCFMALKRSYEHVVGEHFTYRGARVYSPHFDVNARIRMFDTTKLDERPDTRKRELVVGLPSEADGGPRRVSEEETREFLKHDPQLLELIESRSKESLIVAMAEAIEAEDAT